MRHQLSQGVNQRDKHAWSRDYLRHLMCDISTHLTIWGRLTGLLLYKVYLIYLIYLTLMRFRYNATYKSTTCDL